MKRFVLHLVAGWLAISSALAQSVSEKPNWYGPYHTSSAFFRDLLASEPLPPVKLMTGTNVRAEAFAPFDYEFGRFAHQTRSIPFEIGVATGAIAYVGITGWHWGDSKFHFERDCWFCVGTHHGGLDKAGHMFTAYTVTDLLTQRIRANAADTAGAEVTAAIYSMTLMTGIEVLDGFTRKYGFSREDLAADVIGTAFGVARNVVPGLREKLDIRVMYTPASYEHPPISARKFQVIPPYDRTRYIAALKLSGFETFQDTSMRWIELQAGFDARGYTSEERKLGYDKRQNLYVGIGVNLNELIFGKGPLPNLANKRDTEFGWAASNVLDKIQVPYTAYYSGRN